MAATQDLLRDVWHGGQTDRMSPWEQARALAFREASREIHGGRVSVPWVVAHVFKNNGSHLCRQSLHDFFRTVDDSDPDWFPGKHRGKRRANAHVCATAPRPSPYPKDEDGALSVSSIQQSGFQVASLPPCQCLPSQNVPPCALRVAQTCILCGFPTVAA